MKIRAAAFLLVFFLLAAPFASADHNININTADKDALMTLIGIGEVKAQAIIDYRNTNGPFQSIENSMNVSGIGTATYNNIKEHITVQGGSSHISPSPSPVPTPSTPSPSPPPTSSVTSASYVPPPEHAIFADAGDDKTVIVGADVEFTGRAYNKKKETVTGLIRYSWNFGDGGLSEGQAVFHHFVYPGRYAVTLQIAQETETATDRVTVEAQEARLRLVVLSDGALAIENLSGRDLDLSRWILSAGGKTFALPQGTTILKDATATFPVETTGLKAGADPALLYPNGLAAFHAESGASDTTGSSSPSTVFTSTPAPTSMSETGKSRKVVNAKPAFQDPSDDIANEDVRDAPPGDIATSSQMAAASAAVPGAWKWWMSAFALALAGGASVYFARRYSKKEWNIVEE